MKFDYRLLRRLSLALVLSMLFPFLTGCQNQIVEKVGVLPDRPTQFVAHNTETEEETPEGKSWDVQNVDELRLFSADIQIDESPSTHYYNNTAYLYRTASQESDMMLYSLEQIGADGTLTQLHSMIVPKGSYCHYSPSGTAAAYETWIDGCLTLMLVDLISNEERVLWQSDEASLLKDYGISAKLACQWSADGSTLLFMPICFTDPSIQLTETILNADTLPTASDSQAAITDDSEADNSETDDSTESASPEESLPDDESSQPDQIPEDSSPFETVTPPVLSDYDKIQLVYKSLPNFPIIYVYQLEQKNMQSFLIAAEDYPLYDPETTPMICATEDGSQFFVYFNSPWDPSLAHYIDLPNMLHYSTPLHDYLPSFTQLGSEPLFYRHLLYLHVEDVGIMIFDPNQGSLLAQYPFNDPIQSFTIYDNALIVAQPSAIGMGGGVDVTAYLLNLETKQSMLLYHNNETYAPFINHMEMSQDGMHLLIEQLPSEYRTQKQLIQLSFN